MQRGSEAPPSPGLDLLERFSELRDALARLEERDPRAEPYIEDVREAPERDRSGYRENRWGAAHNRSAPTVRTVQTLMRDDVVLQQFGPLEQLAPVRVKGRTAPVPLFKVTPALDESLEAQRRF